MPQPFEPDEHELGELLREAMAVPARPLDRAQTAQLLEGLSAPRRSSGVPLSAALGLAVVALITLVGWSIGQPPGVLRWLGLGTFTANVGLGPLAAAAILWRRRRAHVA
jgi:hypothetical protein